MTITLNTSTNATTGNRQCNSLDLVSTLLDDWVTNQGTKTLTLIIASHCDENTIEITVDIDNVLGDGDEEIPYYINLLPADFTQTTTTLSDGVYKLKFVLTVNATSATTSDIGCKVVTCALECNVAAFQIENITTSSVWSFYETLLYQDNCAQCSCAMACDLYDYILELIQNNDTNDCGCS